MKKANRREFLKKAVAGCASLNVIIDGCGKKPRRIVKEGAKDNTKVAFRELGSTGYMVSELGMGARFAFSGDNVDLAHAVIDSGYNFVDTAPNYMNGRHEELVGKILKDRRQEVFLCTKNEAVNTVLNANTIFKSEEIVAEMEDSLKRLQTDYVDLMLLHGVISRAHVVQEDVMKAFDTARKKGMCRFIGISTHTNQAEVVDAAVEGKFWEAAMVGYNYHTPANVKFSIARARKAGMATIGMKNLLQSKWPNPDPLGDIRKDKSEGITVAQALIKWVLDDPNIDCTIPGFASFEEFLEDLQIMGMDIDLAGISIHKKYIADIDGEYCRGVAGCTGCLNKCPKGVRINELNRCIGYADGYNDIDMAWENYSNLPKSSKADVCADCDTCLVTCINGLDLDRKRKRALELFA